MSIELTTPLSEEAVTSLKVGDMVLISGEIFFGRDAVLPRIAAMSVEEITALLGRELRGGVMFHTAVSPAGVGPTSSNKAEIEGTIERLSELGIRLHLGKGALHPETIAALHKHNAVYAVIPPVTALLGEKTKHRQVAAFPELGMEALHLLTVDAYPAIIAAAGGRSIYE